MKIEVTEDDIKHGTKKDCGKCPIARAVSRVCKTNIVDVQDADDIEVEIVTYQAVQADKRAVSNFIMAFDNDDPVVPFSFTLEEKEDDDEWDLNRG